MLKKTIYHGSDPKRTHSIISTYKNNGVCLNLFNGLKKIESKLKNLDNLDAPIFLDNGSFERFHLFLKNKITKDEYESYDKIKEFYDRITMEYNTILNMVSKPENIILTLPEVISNSDLTIRIQSEYRNKYRLMEQKFGCKIIISLQFIPTKKLWFSSIIESAIYIRENTPFSWRVGIPFGNDFKIIQNENFLHVVNIFSTILKNRHAHLFGCGTINKIKRFAKYNFIFSVDASSVNLWSRNHHFLSQSTHRLLDIRAILGRIKISESTLKKTRNIMANDGITYDLWENQDILTCFSINLQTLNLVLENINFF